MEADLDLVLPSLARPLGHFLRHFAATALLEAGEDLFVVSRILGRASVATTASFYGHVRPAMLQRSAQRMDDLLDRAPGT